MKCFTIFHLFQIIGLFLGFIVGVQIGFNNYGWKGSIVGAFLGGLIGLLIGHIPLYSGYFYLWFDLRRSSSTKLKKRLEKDYFISPQIIAELVRRGETVGQFKVYILVLLQSENWNQRRFGWHNLNIWFPELAKQLPDYDSENPTIEHKTKIL